MPTMINENWANLLEPGLRQIFNVQREALAAESKIPLLFNVATSAKASEHFQGVGGMSDWEVYEGALEYDEFEALYKTTLTHEEYARGFAVPRKLVDDDLYNVITPRPRSLAVSAMRTREKHAASVFNNAFSASYTGGDGVSLCNDSHPLSPTHSSDTVDNAGSSALSYDSLNATRVLMRDYVDDRGELVQLQPDTLLVPADLEEKAWAIFNTMNKLDTADEHANFTRSWLRRVVVWDYLTDANNWFLIDSTLSSLHLHWLDRVPLDLTMDPTSDFNLIAKFRGYMRYSYGWSDWRWIYGHSVS